LANASSVVTATNGRPGAADLIARATTGAASVVGPFGRIRIACGVVDESLNSGKNISRLVERSEPMRRG
jgi:hypothetical protein